jgi:hypothetical protein
MVLSFQEAHVVTIHGILEYTVVASWAGSKPRAPQREEDLPSYGFWSKRLVPGDADWDG